jgi:hypothetical protein
MIEEPLRTLDQAMLLPGKNRSKQPVTQVSSSSVPIVDAYQTICIAPPSDVRAVFQAIREFGAVA